MMKVKLSLRIRLPVRSCRKTEVISNNSVVAGTETMAVRAVGAAAEVTVLAIIAGMTDVIMIWACTSRAQ